MRSLTRMTDASAGVGAGWWKAPRAKRGLASPYPTQHTIDGGGSIGKSVTVVILNVSLKLCCLAIGPMKVNMFCLAYGRQKSRSVCYYVLDKG